MWNTDYLYSGVAHSRLTEHKANLGFISLFALLVVLFAGFMPESLYGQASEEYRYLQSYEVPRSAVLYSELKVSPDSLMIYNDKPFTGLSYELYPNRKLSRIQTYRHGRLDGPSYVWYPAGQPQMYVNYRNGIINGRFIGWYMHGSVLYDMVINNHGFAGDYMEDDGSRALGSEDESDQEGSDNDQTREGQ